MLNRANSFPCYLGCEPRQRKKGCLPMSEEFLDVCFVLSSVLKTVHIRRNFQIRIQIESRAKSFDRLIKFFKHETSLCVRSL